MGFFHLINDAIPMGLGDWASVAGVLIALVGFFITIRNVMRSQSAAEQAEAIVRKLREDNVRVDLIADCATAMSLMEQIKTFHRHKDWILLPDKYSALRGVLVSVKAFDAGLTEEQKSTI